MAELGSPQLPFPVQTDGRRRRAVQLGQQVGHDLGLNRTADRWPPVSRQRRQLQPRPRRKILAGHQATSSTSAPSPPPPAEPAPAPARPGTTSPPPPPAAPAQPPPPRA